MTSLQTTNPNTAVVPSDVSAGAMQAALAGDLSKLTENDRLKFYGALCEFTGLNPLSQPFNWLTFQGKLVLYANKGCAEQLRKIHGVSVDIIERKVEFGCLVVRVKATDKAGRHDESLAAVPFNEKASADAAIAMMKCETKAKRRVTLSICGLGMMDESEVETIKGAAPFREGLSQVETVDDIARKLNAEQPGQSVTVEAEVVPDKPAAKPEPVLASTVQAPEPEQPKANVEPGQPSAEEKFIRELETVLSQNKDSVPYLISQKKLNPGDDLTKLDKVYAGKILARADKFILAVDNWVKGGRK